MISLDTSRCRECRICIDRFSGYCIEVRDGRLSFRYDLCNLCQKCVAICPRQAILVNGVAPDPIESELGIAPEQLANLLARRRSCKQFRDRPLPRELLSQVVAAAAWAPNQNKNISLLVLDDPQLIQLIDAEALRSVRRWYRVLFSFRPLTSFFELFSRSLPVIKKKMEYDLFHRKMIIKKNTQALVILTGDKKVPVTEASAQYLLAAMIVVAESLGVGSCLMDSLRITIDGSKHLRRSLNVHDAVLGVLSLGYSAERVVNIPRGYEPPIRWNI